MTEGASLKRGVICSAELARGLGGLTSCLEATGWGWEVLLLSGDYRVGLGGLTSCLETSYRLGRWGSYFLSGDYRVCARVVAGDLGVGGEDKVGIVTGGVEIGSIQAFGRLKVSQFVGREFVGSSSES